jgi:hypothetical protein
MMGALPPNPQDLTLACYPSALRSRSETISLRPGLAPQSALGSHPCVALSSAEVSTSVPEQISETNRCEIRSPNDIYKVR